MTEDERRKRMRDLINEILVIAGCEPNHGVIVLFRLASTENYQAKYNALQEAIEKLTNGAQSIWEDENETTSAIMCTYGGDIQELAREISKRCELSRDDIVKIVRVKEECLVPQQ